MAEHNNNDEPTLPSKRKSESELSNLPPKIPKLATPDLKQTLQPEPNDANEPLQNDNNDLQNDDEDDDDDDEEEEEEEEEAQVDRKGKGIMRDDKGKGKMIVEDDDDDHGDDDDSDDDSDSDEDGSDDDGSDFSDDPLTEVDLDNILPSRTRRRAPSAGVRISGDAGGGRSGSSDA